MTNDGTQRFADSAGFRVDINLTEVTHSKFRSIGAIKSYKENVV
jgi:hypothetical protein